ncbi:hypothetical protein [Flavobacterium channae]|uniref:hypothetical protein n=1 Tax=Flavobacterium channae TaxID=2897181 RepID=UPI001E326316|nr:hypothetical protein [Flavobacterium channae]UGS23126.1 hypothetical protein LOS89_10190 [Flavobacterium channae]
MVSQIQNAIKEYQTIEKLNDLEVFYNYKTKYKVLFEKSLKEFNKTCTICKKDICLDSYCYCKILFNNEFGIEIISRSEIKGFINIYNGLEKRLNLNEDDNLSDEEKFILKQGQIFDPIDIEKEDDFDPIEIGNEIILNDEDLKLFESNFKDNQNTENPKQVIESKELKFFKDIFIPIGTYLALMQLPILIFISRFFNGSNTIVSKSELMQITFFVFAFGVFGLIVLKSEYENIKINFFKDLYSEKSQTIHFFSSLVIVAISAYEFTIFFIIVGLIIWLISNFNRLKYTLIGEKIIAIWIKIKNLYS